MGSLSLSEENKSKILKTGLYKCKPVLEWLPKSLWKTPYHCKNWTFRPSFRFDEVLMVDTYFGCNFVVKLTDENVKDFVLVFDYEKVRDCGTRKPEGYAEHDIFCVAVDSGGMRFPHYFLKKNAEKDNSVLLALAVKRLENARREVEYAKSDSVLHTDGDWTYRISYFESDVLREDGGFKTPIEAYNAAVTERNGFCWFNADIRILSKQEIEEEKLENCLEEDYNV